MLGRDPWRGVEEGVYEQIAVTPGWFLSASCGTLEAVEVAGDGFDVEAAGADPA
jgi:hypothetical protein